MICIHCFQGFMENKTLFKSVHCSTSLDPFTIWWGIAHQPHLRAIVRRYLQCSSAPPRLHKTLVILLCCSVSNILRPTQPFGILEEWMPLHGVARIAIVAPAKCVKNPLPIPSSDHSAHKCQACAPSSQILRLR